MEAVLFIGVQGSGKTTFYRERFLDTHVRISRDMLKTPQRERVLLSACLAAEQSFVVDNTNALASRRAEIIAAARAAGFRVVGYEFRTTLGDALRRNARRPGGGVPRAGVAATFKRMQRPRPAEGFDALRVVEIDAGERFTVREWSEEEAPAPRAAPARDSVE
jgi:predicted kinase